MTQGIVSNMSSFLIALPSSKQMRFSWCLLIDIIVFDPVKGSHLSIPYWCYRMHINSMVMENIMQHSSFWSQY